MAGPKAGRSCHAEDQSKDNPAAREAGTDKEKRRRKISTNGNETVGGSESRLVRKRNLKKVGGEAEVATAAPTE